MYQGPTITLIPTDRGSKAPFVDRGSDINVTSERPLKKKASLIEIVPSDAVYVDVQVKTASTDDIARDLFMLEIRAMEKVGGPLIDIVKRSLIRPGKVSPPKPAIPRPEVSPEALQRSLQPDPSVAKGKAREIAYRRTDKGVEVVSPKKVEAPKGYEYLEKKEKLPFKESDQPFKEELRTPVRQALSKVPIVGKRLGKGEPVEFASKKEYEYLRPKVISGDIPRQIGHQIGRGAKGVVGAAAGVGRSIPILGTLPAVSRALKQAPLKERRAYSAIEGMSPDYGFEKGRRKLKKKIEGVEPPKTKPELAQLPGDLRKDPDLTKRTIKASEDVGRFKRLTEAEQIRDLSGSVQVKNQVGKWRTATKDEIAQAVKEYRQKGAFPSSYQVSGHLGQAHALSGILDQKKLPAWATEKGRKQGLKIPFSAEEAEKQEGIKKFRAGAAESARSARAKRQEEMSPFTPVGGAAEKKIPTPKDVVPPEGGAKPPEGGGKPGTPPPTGPTPTPKDLVPPSGGAAVAKQPPGKPITTPKSLDDLRRIASGKDFHKVNVKDIRDIVSKEFRDPKDVAGVTRQFVDLRQRSQDAATRGVALGKGLDVAGGKAAPAGAPAPDAAPAAASQPKPEAPPAAEKPKIDVGGVAKSIQAVSSQGNISPSEQMLYYAQMNKPPEGTPEHAAYVQRLSKATELHKAMQNVPLKNVSKKIQEFLRANPQDAEFFQGVLEQYGAGSHIPGAVNVFQTGGRQGPIAAKYTISADDEQARAAAKAWVKKVQVDIPTFDHTDPWQFAQAKERIKMSPTAAKAFVQVQPEGGMTGRSPLQTTLSAGPSAGGVQPTEQQIQAEQTKRVLQDQGYPILSTSTVPGAQGAGLPPGVGQGGMDQGGAQRALTGGTQTELPADMSKRIADVVGGGSPELRSFMETQGVNPGGGFMEGAMNMLPWFAVPMGLQAMGIEGILPQLAGYATIPYLQQKMQGAMGRDPEKIRKATQAYLAGQPAGQIPAPVPQG